MDEAIVDGLSEITGQCPEWGAGRQNAEAVFCFRLKLTLPEGEGPASGSKLS